VYQGTQPTLGAYRKPPQGLISNIPDAAMQNAARNAAMRYARMRLNQMMAVISALPPELQAQIRAANQNPNLAAGYRGVSGRFADASRAAGYQDPRYYLRYVLPAMVQRNAQNLLR